MNALCCHQTQTDSFAAERSEEWLMVCFIDLQKVSSPPSAGSADLPENPTSALLFNVAACLRKVGTTIYHRTQMYRSQRSDEMNLLLK